MIGDLFEELMTPRTLCSYFEWDHKKDNTMPITYWMGYKGYAEGEMFLDDHHHELKIKSFKELSVSDGTPWWQTLRKWRKDQNDEATNTDEATNA